MSGGDISTMTDAEFGTLVDECRADFWRAVEQRAARFAGGLDQGDPGCDHCGGDGEIGSKGDLMEPCPCRRRR